MCIQTSIPENMSSINNDSSFKYGTDEPYEPYENECESSIYCDNDDSYSNLMKSTPKQNPQFWWVVKLKTDKSRFNPVY